MAYFTCFEPKAQNGKKRPKSTLRGPKNPSKSSPKVPKNVFLDTLSKGDPYLGYPEKWRKVAILRGVLASDFGQILAQIPRKRLQEVIFTPKWGKIDLLDPYKTGLFLGNACFSQKWPKIGHFRQKCHIFGHYFGPCKKQGF